MRWNRNKINLLKFDGKNNSLYFAMDSTDSIYFYGAEAKEGKIIKLNYNYILDKLKKHNYLKNKTIIEIGQYTLDLILRKLKEDLKLYVINNINDYSFYNNEFIYNVKNKIDKDLIYESTRNCTYSYDYSDINNNFIIVKYHYSNCKIIINILTEDIEFYRNDEKVSSLNCMFSKDTLNIAVAQEQYRKGIAPNMLNEFLKLQSFLSGKSSVRIITNDNTVHHYKTRYYGDISNMINYYRDKFYISSYCLNENDDIDLKDVVGFKFGKKEYYFDSKVLLSPIV